MGLFDRLKKKEAKEAASDDRPIAPMELLERRERECAKVHGCRYFQDALSNLPGNFADVTIGECKMKDWDAYPVTVSGAMVGVLYDKELEKSGFKPGSNALAEIQRPIYMNLEDITLYIRRTPEAIAEDERLESLEHWMNIDVSKWRGPEVERQTFADVEVVANGKSYTVTAEGVELFEVSSRMKAYKQLEERERDSPKRLFAELRSGDYGQYYRVGFFYK